MSLKKTLKLSKISELVSKKDIKFEIPNTSRTSSNEVKNSFHDPKKESSSYVEKWEFQEEIGKVLYRSLLNVKNVIFKGISS